MTCPLLPFAVRFALPSAAPNEGRQPPVCGQAGPFRDGTPPVLRGPSLVSEGSRS